jgi:hypothetical protein
MNANPGRAIARSLSLTRFLGNADATLGVLRLDGRVGWFTLEDQYRAVKVAAETRIPAGSYEVGVRTDGGMVGRYRAKYNWHRGMLWLHEVPGFEFIYLHVGNTAEDTAGCILVAHGARLDSMTLQQSVVGYKALYRKVISAAEAGVLRITIEDRDR